MATNMKVAGFWDVTRWSLVDIDRRFRGAYYPPPHRVRSDGGSKVS
jgi:hypothetical protein